MIPIRNRKKTLKLTVEEMRNFAFAYTEKYAPSKQQLKTYLLKKYLKASVPNVKKQDITNLIDIVLSDLEKNKFINDQFYSDSKAKSMIQRGSSINKIRNYLIGKGINNEFIKDTVNKRYEKYPVPFDIVVFVFLQSFLFPLIFTFPYLLFPFFYSFRSGSLGFD